MKIRHLSLAAAALAAAFTLTAAASEGHHHDREGREGEHREGREEHRGREASARGPIDPLYAKECGACHLAYPPAMLPAASWRAMLGTLDRHFGQNAELGDADRARLEGWLTAQAGPDRGEAPARITGLSWFRKEHRKVGPEVVARPAIGSLANCAACHQGAASWDFDEDRVRIPRG